MQKPCIHAEEGEHEFLLWSKHDRNEGTLQHYRTRITKCSPVAVSGVPPYRGTFMVENEYEIFAEYAQSDGVEEVNFKDYVTTDDSQLFENCINHENDDPLELVRNQIDMHSICWHWPSSGRIRNGNRKLKRRLALMSRRKAQLMKQ